MQDDSETNLVNFDEKKYKALQKRYNKAVEDKEEQFTFEGNIYLTNYAKYVIEYLSTKFEKP